jgi:hypothetical protein
LHWSLLNYTGNNSYQVSQLSRTTKFHVDNKLPYPVRVHAIRDGRDEIVQDLAPGGSFRGNIDRNAGVRILVKAAGECGDSEIMPSAYARVNTTETFVIEKDGIKRIVADELDPWSHVAGGILTGVALYYLPEYGPRVLSELDVKEARLASCYNDWSSVGCTTGAASYLRSLYDTYGADKGVKGNACLRKAYETAQARTGPDTPPPIVVSTEESIQRVHREVIGSNGGPAYVAAAQKMLSDGGTLQDVRIFLVDSHS